MLKKKVTEINLLWRKSIPKKISAIYKRISPEPREENVL
jgi:hypothetical protein